MADHQHRLPFPSDKKKIITKIYTAVERIILSSGRHCFHHFDIDEFEGMNKIVNNQQKKIFSKSVNDMAFWHQFQRFPSSRFCAQRRNARQQNAIKSASFPLHPPLPCHPFSFFFFFASNRPEFIWQSIPKQHDIHRRYSNWLVVRQMCFGHHKKRKKKR